MCVRGYNAVSGDEAEDVQAALLTCNVEIVARDIDCGDLGTKVHTFIDIVYFVAVLTSIMAAPYIRVD